MRSKPENDWSDWKAWEKVWEQWEKSVGKERVNLKHIQFVDLYNYFLRQVERLGYDPHEADIKAWLDPRLSYLENKRILDEFMHKPPTDEEYEAMYQQYKGELESQVKERYPEVWETWRKRIEELEKEVEKLPEVERKYKKYKALAEDLAYKLEETERRFEKEKKALEEKLAPIRLRVLRDWDEGIMKYRVGMVFESRDLDWAADRIEKGYAERVPVEVPVYVPPPPKELTLEEKKRLEDTFRVTLTRELGRIPRDVMAEFRLELDAAKFQPFEKAREIIEKLAKEIVERERAPPPAVVRPPVVRPPEVEVAPPVVRPVELPKTPLSPLKFPRRPASEEIPILWDYFVYRLAEMGLDAWVFRSWFEDYIANSWFSQWEGILRNFELLMKDLEEGKPKRVFVKVPVWKDIPRDPVLHLLATGRYRTMDELLEALNLYGIYLEPKDVVEIVKTEWAKTPRDSWLLVTSKGYLEKIVGQPLS